MARKLLGWLSAEVSHRAEGPVIVVRARKTTPAFDNPDATDILTTIRILRSDEHGFEFGNDYEEYFHSVSADAADTVFEGPLEADNGRTYTFEDRAVEVGHTYCYWISGSEAEPTGPVAVKVRDPRVWWPFSAIEARVAEIVAGNPALVESRTIGHTVRGRPLVAVRAGRARRCVAVVGAVHGGEAGPELALGSLELLLAECPDLLNEVGMMVIPVVNADEREREVLGTPWYLRTNAAGVDLNRNFPVDWETVERGYGLDSSDPTSATYRGPTEGSEPETRAVIAHLTETRPLAVFAFHCLASICGVGFITARDAEADKEYAQRCTDLAAAYIAGSGVAIPPEKTCGFVCTSGSLPAWCRQELGVPSFDLEINAAAEAEAYSLCIRDRTDAALVSRYQRLHANGLRAALEYLAGT